MIPFSRDDTTYAYLYLLLVAWESFFINIERETRVTHNNIHFSKEKDVARYGC